jgi:hypothetical protein
MALMGSNLPLGLPKYQSINSYEGDLGTYLAHTVSVDLPRNPKWSLLR